MRIIKSFLVLCLLLAYTTVFAQSELKITRVVYPTSGTTVNVYLALNNEVELRGLQFCLPIPEGLTFKSIINVSKGPGQKQVEVEEEDEDGEPITVTSWKDIVNHSSQVFGNYVKDVVSPASLKEPLPAISSGAEIFRVQYTKLADQASDEKDFVLSNVVASSPSGNVPMLFLAGYIGKNGYSTYSAANPAKVQAPTEIYYAQVEDDVVNLIPTEDNTIDAKADENTGLCNGFVLKGIEGEPFYLLSQKTVPQLNKEDNDLIGTVYGINKSDVHVLTTEDGVTGFYKYSGFIPAGKAYLQGVVGAKASIRFADETGIEEISAEDLNGVIFNLNGQKVNEVKKGIHIVNGKKVMF